MPTARNPSPAGGLRLVAAVALITLTAACGGTPDGPSAGGPASAAGAPAAERLDPGRFAAAVAEPDRTTVNVHVPFAGDVPGTDLSIPYDQLQARAEALPADRSTPLAVYCRTGQMSAVAVATLADLGYTDVVELAGGMVAWEQAGRELLTTPSAG